MEKSCSDISSFIILKISVRELSTIKWMAFGSSLSNSMNNLWLYAFLEILSRSSTESKRDFSSSIADIFSINLK